VHGNKELALSIHVASVLAQMPGPVTLQPILHTSIEEACEDRLIDGKLHLLNLLLTNK